MRVENNNLAQSLLKSNTKGKRRSDFDEILKTNLSYQDKDNLMNTKLENFKQSLSENGAYGYLMGLSQQKIDEKIAQKKAELKNSFEIDNADKSDSEKNEIKALIDELVAEYKTLLEYSAKNNVLDQKRQSMQKQGTFINLAQLMSQIS